MVWKLEDGDELDLGGTLEQVRTVRHDQADPGIDALLAASEALLVAKSAPTPLGQCKKDDPYAPIYVVFDSGGNRLECTHKPPHSQAL